MRDDYRRETFVFTSHTRVEHIESGWEFCGTCHVDWPCRDAFDHAAAENAQLRAALDGPSEILCNTPERTP